MDAASTKHSASAVRPEPAAGILRSPTGVFVLIFLLAFAVRASLLVLWVSNHHDFYRLGGEVGKVALSLMRTGRFADPYMIPTGPTAHPLPFWPALLALIYYAFGVTPTAGYAANLVGICSHSALYALLPGIGQRLGLARRAGVVAGVTGALLPLQGLSEAIGVGLTAHMSLAFAALVLALRQRWSFERRFAAGSLLLGVGCGAAFHLLPPLLLVVLGSLAFELLWKRDRRTWLLCACVVAGAALTCAPWTLRNYEALRGLFFIRSNFGLELRIANHAGADANMEVTAEREAVMRHPSVSLEEARQVRDLGEGEYMRRARNEALEWISGHPAEFLRLTLMRVLHFWCGPLRYPWLAALFTTLSALAFLGLRRILPTLAAPGRAALVIPLATFPLVYYVVSYVAHYPAPLAWLLLLLAGHEAQAWFARGSPEHGAAAAPARPHHPPPRIRMRRRRSGA
jgi:4-amino-4-deoxy-L-arabinose transferase-like glycosyltransferase